MAGGYGSKGVGIRRGCIWDKRRVTHKDEIGGLGGLGGLEVVGGRERERGLRLNTMGGRKAVRL